jgi:hypothetical protein
LPGGTTNDRHSSALEHLDVGTGHPAASAAGVVVRRPRAAGIGGELRSSRSPLPERLGAIEVQTAFRPQTPGSFDPLQIDWQGRWISATTSGSAGLTAAGDGHTLPAQQQAELHTFPLRDYLRPGIWQICLMAVGDGTPVVQHHCTVEIVGDQINRVQFTEGGIGCACTLPCQAPDPDAEVLEPCPQ